MLSGCRHGLLTAGPGPNTTLRTPRTEFVGTAQRGVQGGTLVMLSPAPLSIRARTAQQHREAPGAATASPAPIADTGTLRRKLVSGVLGAVAEDEKRVTVVLPSPMPSAQHNPRIRPLGPHNASAGAGLATAQEHALVKQECRTPRAKLAAAVLAARQAAASALTNGGMDGSRGTEQGAAGTSLMDVDAASDGAAGQATHSNKGGGLAAGPAGVNAQIKAEAAAAGGKAAKPPQHGGRTRTNKRRHA